MERIKDATLSRDEGALVCQIKYEDGKIESAVFDTDAECMDFFSRRGVVGFTDGRETDDGVCPGCGEPKNNAEEGKCFKCRTSDVC